MVVALALLAGSALVAFLVPMGLRRLADTPVDPQALIVAWVLSAIGALGTATAGITVLLVPGHGVPGPLVAVVHGCWLALRHGSPPAAELLVGVAGWVLVAALAVRLAVIGRQEHRRRGIARRERLATLRIVGRTEPGAPATLWLEHDRPLAFSLPGRPGFVVATDGLARELTPDQLGAVLEHERAHLRGRHHVLLAGVDALRAALPFLPLFRQASAALRDLVELAADAAAVRRHGARALRSALLRVAGHGAHHLAPGGALAAGRDAIDLRLRRLDRLGRRRTPVVRVLRCTGAGATAAVLPLLVGTGILLLAGSVFCPVP